MCIRDSRRLAQHGGSARRWCRVFRVPARSGTARRYGYGRRETRGCARCVRWAHRRNHRGDIAPGSVSARGSRRDRRGCPWVAREHPVRPFSACRILDRGCSDLAGVRHRHDVERRVELLGRDFAALDKAEVDDRFANGHALGDRVLGDFRCRFVSDELVERRDDRGG